MASPKTDSYIVADYDMGRRGDASTLTFSVPHLGFSEQLAVCCAIIDSVPISEFRIDPTGVGAQLAEALAERYGPERIKELVGPERGPCA